MKKMIISSMLISILFFSCNNPSAETTYVTTLAGTGTYGYVNGTGTEASFSNPCGITVDSSGIVYVADNNNSVIRKISANGTVTTFAGNGIATSKDGTGTSAGFHSPQGLVADASGNIYVSDTFSDYIRKIDSNIEVTTLATTGLDGPYGMAVDSSGNLYVADKDSHSILKITSAGVVTTFAGTGSEGSADGTGTSASFKYPSDIAIDSSGNFYVGDWGNHSIRKITPSGVVTTFAGTGSSGYTDGMGTTASFYGPRGIAVDSSDNVYVADAYNDVIRKITSDGEVTTYAGTGSEGFDNGLGTEASFNTPTNVAVDGSGNVYVSDSGNESIRKITR